MDQYENSPQLFINKISMERELDRIFDLFKEKELSVRMSYNQPQSIVRRSLTTTSNIDKDDDQVIGYRKNTESPKRRYE